MADENNNNQNNDQKNLHAVKTDANGKAKAPVKPDEMAQPNLNPTNTADDAKLNQWIEDLAKKSAIKNQMLCNKVVFIDKGKPGMYALRLHFPGTLEASDIQTASVDSNGNMSAAKLMQNAVDHHVIVAPVITDLESFASTHKSFGEAANQVFNFLDDGIRGKLL